jgi:hypothetical protein
MDEENTPSKIDLQYAEKEVIFLICDCSLNKKYSFYVLSRQQAENLITRLRYIEKLTWAQWSNLPRAKGLTTESRDSASFTLIDSQNTSPQKLTEQYYFHFRVGDDKFRVFGYQKKQYFCITHIDPDGKIHDH